MTKKELNIIGRAYQSAFDQLVESLNYNGSEDVEHQLKLIGVADTWVQFPKLTKPQKQIDEKTFNLLKIIGKDADLYHTVAIMFMASNEKGLLKLMEIQEELSWKTNMTAFANQIKKSYTSKPRFTGEELAISLMEICLRNFECIVECINNDEPLPISIEEWCEEWKGKYQIEKVTKSNFI